MTSKTVLNGIIDTSDKRRKVLNKKVDAFMDRFVKEAYCKSSYTPIEATYMTSMIVYHTMSMILKSADYMEGVTKEEVLNGTIGELLLKHGMSVIMNEGNIKSTASDE